MSPSTSWHRSVVALVAGLVLAAPIGAQAGILTGLSIRGGFWRPDSGFARSAAGDVMWGGGLEYQLAHFPSFLNGDQWSTSISADFHYAQKKNYGVSRMIPVALNQVYTFDQEGCVSPYAGFFVAAVTISGTHQSTVTRLGGGLIGGLDFGKSLYIEGRYQVVDDHHLNAKLPGLFGYVGYRF